MKQKPQGPTEEFYGFLQLAYSQFNNRLFAGELPSCMITVQREKKTMGFFSADRWISPDGTRKHELALNPAYFGRSNLVEVFQTLVHEQCHIWQHEFGHTSRAGYHNNEWAHKMKAIGLIPSDSGKSGGKQTGQKMSDYPDPGGRFIRACAEFLTSYEKLPWMDRYLAITESCQLRHNEDDLIETLDGIGLSSKQVTLLQAQLSEFVDGLDEPEPYQVAARANKVKTRYTCKGCNTNVWGKPELSIICGVCDLQFESG